MHRLLGVVGFEKLLQYKLQPPIQLVTVAMAYGESITTGGRNEKDTPKSLSLPATRPTPKSE